MTTLSQTQQEAADGARFYAIKATELRNLRQYADAEDTIREGLQHYPDDAYLWNALGRRVRSSSTGSDDEALKAFHKAYHLSPADSFFACDYADFLYKKGYPEASEVIYLRALSYKNEGRSRENLFVLIGLGNIYQKNAAKAEDEKTRKDALKGAVICFGRAVEIAPYDHIAERRYTEICRIAPTRYSEESWHRFEEFSKRIQALAAGSVGAPGMEPTFD